MRRERVSSKVLAEPWGKTDDASAIDAVIDTIVSDVTEQQSNLQRGPFDQFEA